MTTLALLMAYGTPATPADIERYYTDIRRGRPPTAEQLADLVARYQAIGGLSPLVARTEAQRAAIAASLEHEAPGEFAVAVGFRHAGPFIEQTIDDSDAERIVGLVLAPHYSSMSVARYHERAEKAAAAVGLPYTAIGSWATEPAYIDFLAAAVSEQVATLPPRTHVMFTAHSLPSRILDAGDPYPGEVLATAGAAAARAGLAEDSWSAGWQSAGRTAEPWLTPDVLTVIDTCSVDPDVDGLLVCPCGFVADHLEVLYDLDHQARERATERGLAFQRTAVVNDDQAVMAALASRIASAADTPAS